MRFIIIVIVRLGHYTGAQIRESEHVRTTHTAVIFDYPDYFRGKSDRTPAPVNCATVARVCTKEREGRMMRGVARARVKGEIELGDRA